MNLYYQKYMAMKIAWKLYGLPYRWGGNDSVGGYDCSGTVIEILQSIGILPYPGDWSAAGLYDYFETKSIPKAKRGALVFWHNGTKIYHVGFCLNEDLCLQASGGGPTTLTEEDAIKQDAYINVRPIRNAYAFADPFK